MSTIAEVSAPALLTRSPWKIAGIGRSLWCSLRAQGLTPLPVAIGRRSQFYRTSDVLTWVANLPQTNGRPRAGKWPGKAGPGRGHKQAPAAPEQQETAHVA